MPGGFLTEQGPQPEFADLYGAHELPTLSYAVRTLANVRAAEAVVWFGNLRSAGARYTVGACEKIGCAIALVSRLLCDSIALHVFRLPPLQSL
jgi:hypothetical protein